MFKGPQGMSLAGNAAADSAAAISTAADVAVVRYYCCCCCCKFINLIIFFKVPYLWSNFHNFGQIFLILVKLPQFWSNFLSFGQIFTILVKFPHFCIVKNVQSKVNGQNFFFRCACTHVRTQTRTHVCTQVRVHARTCTHVYARKLHFKMSSKYKKLNSIINKI